MVFKLWAILQKHRERFENDVNLYGIQTEESIELANDSFENDVNLYGIQTIAE